MIKLTKPSFEQLEYTKYLWSDEQTMRDVGGVRTKSESEWHEWYHKMVEPTDCCNQYFQIYNNDIPIGEISFHRYNASSRSADFNIKIEHQYRRKGYAREAFKLFTEFFFNEFGGEFLNDNVTSTSGIKFLENLGFDLDKKEEEVSIFKYAKR